LDSSDFRTPVIRLTEQCEQLLQVLISEHQALIDNRIEELALLTERKSELSVDVHHLEQHLRSLLKAALPSAGATDTQLQLSAYIELQNADMQAEFRPLLSQLKSKIEECRHRNAVNGRMVQRSRQSTQALMQLLTGHQTDVYGASGHTSNTPTAQHIAEA